VFLRRRDDGALLTLCARRVPRCFRFHDVAFGTQQATKLDQLRRSQESINPINSIDPGNPANPINRVNPNNPFNPINEVNPNNPLNPINRYNPDRQFAPLNQPYRSDH
jgi:hypothetical protein